MTAHRTCRSGERQTRILGRCRERVNHFAAQQRLLTWKLMAKHSTNLGPALHAPPGTSTECSIALGGNLGEVPETFRQALRRLNAARGIDVQAVSRAYRTPSIGAHAGPDFLNAAARIKCAVDPEQLLSMLLDIENQLGRKREHHWGPRTLDLDLLLYGTETIHTPRLTVPHPALWYRRFVLDPLCELAAAIRHPIKRVPLAHLRGRLLERPLSCGLVGGLRDERQRLLAAVRERVPQVEWSDVSPSLPEASAVRAWSALTTLTVWLGSDPERPQLAFSDLPLVSRLDMSAGASAGAERLVWVAEAALGTGIEPVMDLA